MLSWNRIISGLQTSKCFCIVFYEKTRWIRKKTGRTIGCLSCFSSIARGQGGYSFCLCGLETGDLFERLINYKCLERSGAFNEK